MPAIPSKVYIINEALVNKDVSDKKFEILHESVVGDEIGSGLKLFTVTFKQVLQDFGVRNWNGRIYSRDIVVNALNNNALIQHDISMSSWCGEYGHPIIEKGMNELARQMTIFPPNACWTINKYWEEGNLLMGECTTLASGYGDVVRNRLLSGFRPQASSRAIGGVDKNGNVLPGYTPITFDCVIRPSHKTAYEVAGSEQYNFFPIQTKQPNTMSESAVAYKYNEDPAFKNFLLSENTSRVAISSVCETLGLDYDSMTVDGKNIKLWKLDENGGSTTVLIPLNQLVNTEYYNLF